MKAQGILPGLASVAVIVFVAILEEESKLVAALTATMLLGATLALWIVYSSARGEQLRSGGRSSLPSWLS